MYHSRAARFVFISALARLGLKIHDRMPGMFLTLARFGEKAMHIMPRAADNSSSMRQIS
jgi:hypothetical protein